MRQVRGSGDRVGGRYVLVDELGDGGMATAWRAWDTAQARYVCVKLASLGEDVALRQRWVAESASRINGPHLLGAEDWNSGQHGDYIVMRLMNGGTLGDLVDRHGPLPPGQVVQVLRQGATALQTMHRRHLLHRDIKPSNLLLDPTPRGAALALSVADFGVIAGEVSSGLTSASSGPVGTAGFIPPEAYPSRLDGSAAEPSPRGDIYALGVTAYFAATGELATALGAGETPAGWRRFADPSELRFPAHVPDDVAELIRAMLSPDPDDRPRTASALLMRCEDLVGLGLDLGEGFDVPVALPPLPQEWGRDGPRSGSAPAKMPTTLPTTATETATATATTAAHGRRRWLSVVAALGAGAVLAGAGLAWANGYRLPLGSGQPDEGPSTPVAAPPALPTSPETSAETSAATSRSSSLAGAGAAGASASDEVVRFTHFDVSVRAASTDGSGRFDVTVRVCVTSPAPDAVNGLTRISWEPWLLAARGISPVKPAAELAGGPGLLPQSEYYASGTCAEGDLPFRLPSGSEPSTVLYRNGQGDAADFALAL